MRYYKKDIVFQEVPGEITLCFLICGCPLRCQGCHSPFTWNEHTGNLLTAEAYIRLLDQYQGSLTCVLFMGGEWHEDELHLFLKIARQRGLKTCLYTGLENVSAKLKSQLSYLKTGPWIASLGGLDSPRTNQRMIQLDNKECLNQAFYKKPLVG
jgi:anaerobic ribonucleoside-triphosphate reductase activating protein